MKTILKKLATVIVVFAVISPLVAVAGFDAGMEQQLQALKTKYADIDAEECINLVPVYDFELLKFLTFIESVYQSKSANSSLTTLAIQGFSEYKTSMRAIINNISPAQTNSENQNSYMETILSYNNCEEVNSAYIELGKQKMIDHIKANSAKKKAIMLMEKLKSINDRLRKLNSTIAELLGYYGTFKNKFPCFVDKCQ